MIICQIMILTIFFLFLIFWIYESIIRYYEIVKIYITDYDLSFKNVKGFKKDIYQYYLETTMDNREKVYCITYFLNEFDVWSYIILNEDRSKMKYVPVAIILKK